MRLLLILSLSIVLTEADAQSIDLSPAVSNNPFSHQRQAHQLPSLTDRPAVGDNLMVAPDAQVNDTLATAAELSINTESLATTDLLLQDKALTEALITQAMVEKHWDWLAYLLPIYRQIPEYDLILADYAQGALLREQRQHGQAIALYHNILAKQPELVYVRLNLATMLFENKAIKEAKAQFEQVLSHEVVPQTKQLVKYYLSTIAKIDRWQGDFALNYEQNNNVNNASAEKNIVVGGLTFKKDAESLPQKARGFSYAIGLTRDFNLSGNHYLEVDAGLNGVSYWDNHDYDQINLRGAMGYLYRDIRQQVALKPYLERAWFASQSYSKTVGVQTQYKRWLNDQWQAIAVVDFSKSHYQTAPRFNGKRLLLSSTLVYAPSTRWALWGGLDWRKEGAKDEAEAATKTSVRAGGAYGWPIGLHTRLNLRYGKRDFKGDNFYFKYPRKDKEYSSLITIWHRDIELYGITPKFNWQYEKIDSNISSFYSRTDNQFYMSFDKAF